MDINALLAALQSSFNAAVDSAVAAKLQPLQQQIVALETKLAEASLFTRSTTTSVELDPGRIAEALNAQEWFWEKIQRFCLAQSIEVTFTDEHLAKISGMIDRSSIVDAVDWSEEMDYGKLAGEIDYSALANEIDYSALANEIDAETVAENLDVESALHDFFNNHDVSLRVR